MFGVQLSYLGTAIGLFWQNTSRTLPFFSNVQSDSFRGVGSHFRKNFRISSMDDLSLRTADWMPHDTPQTATAPRRGSEAGNLEQHANITKSKIIHSDKPSSSQC
jgi:hypothetical protein